MPKPPTPPYRTYSSTYGAATKNVDPAALRKRRYRIGFFAVAGVAALIFSATWNPPTGRVHEFTSASDYSDSREGGCTNSGEGCHGKEVAFKDFNEYHPDADCTDCHDYEGVGCIPCHSPKNHECQVCHDGTMKQAPDRVRLGDPYPRGHYRETSHTAMATDFKQPVRTAAGGKAAATCKDCHARDLQNAHNGVPIVAGSKYGDSLGCGECHNDVRSYGQAEVLSDWKEKSCESCHKVDSSSPMHGDKVAGEVKGKSPLKCGETGAGCHATSDLHAVHPDAPKKCSGSASADEPGCHDLELQAQSPTAITCAGGGDACHPAYVNDDYSHKKDREVHGPEGTAAAGDTSVSGVACGACHLMEPDGVSLASEHARSFSALTNDPNSCINCHSDGASKDAIVNDWPGRDSASACGECHGRDGLDAGHTAALPPLHVAENSGGCAETGNGCHPGLDLASVGSTGLHASCVRCHAPSSGGGNVAYDPGNKSCGEDRSCHGGNGQYDPATSVHNGSESFTDGADSAHLASLLSKTSYKDPLTTLSVTCTSCHSNRLGTEHARPSSALYRGSGTACIRCHSRSALTASVVKADWPSSGKASACNDCHGASGVGAVHTNVATVHAGRELALSGNVVVGECAGAGCHNTTELRSLHVRSGCTPSGCHQSTGNINGTRQKSCGGPSGGAACHAGYSATAGHSEGTLSHAGIELDLLGAPTSGFCVGLGCHVSNNLKTLHGTDGCAIPGCHEPGLSVGLTSCGGADSAMACHNAFSATEHFVSHSADLTGTVSGITYRAGENIGCFGCHDADLFVSHTATAGAEITGGGASNCRVCHHEPADPGNGLYAGLSSVVGAVATNDFRCTTCHASDAAIPSASAAASAHRRTSTLGMLPAGYVWADPFEQWRTAFESPVGGGHNVLSATLTGGPTTKAFPVTSYASEGTTYTWNLPANSGDTTWLDSSALGGADVSTAEAISHVTIACDDCHSMSEAMAGPHGSAVRINIDPAYSQTEYANPTRGLASQFDATGTSRVVCAKCHTLLSGSVPGTSTPGGHPVHARHVRHLSFPSTHPIRYGEKCVDCHVRIPHAWRSARLLVRTIAETGRPADAFPYVSSNHRGLAGIVLGDFTTSADLTPASCTTGGCHGYHDETTHPEPSDIPGAKYWP